MALYIFDKPYCDNGIPYALMDEHAMILLLHDALSIDPDLLKDKDVLVMKKEVEERGLSGHLSENYLRIDYDELIDLITAHKVINFS